MTCNFTSYICALPQTTTVALSRQKLTLFLFLPPSISLLSSVVIKGDILNCIIEFPGYALLHVEAALLLYEWMDGIYK